MTDAPSFPFEEVTERPAQPDAGGHEAERAVRSARIVPTRRLILNGTCARLAATAATLNEDLEMPRWDGRGVVDELRAQMRTATLPVIVLTAQSGESEEKALDLGAHHYLTKPVPTGSLMARVRAVLKRIKT